MRTNSRWHTKDDDVVQFESKHRAGREATLEVDGHDDATPRRKLESAHCALRALLFVVESNWSQGQEEGWRRSRVGPALVPWPSK